MTQLNKKQILRRARRVVIKVGSQILSSQTGIEEGRLKGLVRDLAGLHDQKKDVVVVSSGAVAAGMTRLAVKERPKTIPQKQALAAVGQIKLMALYELHFALRKECCPDAVNPKTANRQRYLNAKHTFKCCLSRPSSRSSTKTTQWPSKK
jgi:glutamate 5-kinase